MVRLTEKITNKETGEILAYRTLPNVKDLKVVQQLGKYEDVGLSPEQVQQLRKREEILMDYIMRHTYFCPIKNDANINFEKECVGFKEPGCRECIMRNLKELR